MDDMVKINIIDTLIKKVLIDLSVEISQFAFKLLSILCENCFRSF